MKGNLGQRNEGHVGKSKTLENYISAIMFILRHHLHHIIIGFGMSSKFSFPLNSLSHPPTSNASRRISSHTLTAATTKCTHRPAITAPRSPLVHKIPQQPTLHAGVLTLMKQLPLCKKFWEDEAESFDDKYTFLSSFHFMPDDFDMDSHEFDLDTLKNKLKVKGSLRKNLEHWYQIGANPSVIGTAENGYKISFFTTPVSKFFQNNQSTLQNAKIF